MSSHTEAETTGIHAAGKPEGSGKMIFWTLLLFAAIGGVLYWSFTHYSVTGSVTSTGPTLGDWTVRPGICTTQSLATPKAFTISSSSGWKMVLSSEPSNPPVISVGGADGRLHTVEFDRCGNSDIQAFEPPDSGMLNGSFNLDCSVGQSHLTAHVEFENCK